MRGWLYTPETCIPSLNERSESWSIKPEITNHMTRENAGTSI